MNSQNAIAIKHQPKWRWPIKISLYNRSPLLSEAEREAIASALQLRDEGNMYWLRKSRMALDRLLRPLDDVLDYTKVKLSCYRAGVTGILLNLMNKRGTSYWSWSTMDWVEALCPTRRAFQAIWPASQCRLYIMSFCYFTADFMDFHLCGDISTSRLASRVFGKANINKAIETMRREFYQLGYADKLKADKINNLLCKVMLFSRSPHLEGITLESLIRVRESYTSKVLRANVVPLSRALLNLGIIPEALEPRNGIRILDEEGTASGVPSEWVHWCKRWRETSTLSASSRSHMNNHLMKTGRWLGQQRPELASPQAWGYEDAAEYVAMITKAKVGDWAARNRTLKHKIGKPLSPRSISGNLASLRTFFRDCQEWNWFPSRFNPNQAFRTPKSIRSQIAPDPRVIADEIWAKLLWAGLNLKETDLPLSPVQSRAENSLLFYPIEMVRAVAMVWLFGGLRSDEIVRLRIGCIRWQREDVTIPGTQEVLPKDAVCWLEVPVNKTGAAFTKPVDRPVGEAIEMWERRRPTQPLALDPKTGEMVHYLFSSRGKRVGSSYINLHLIPHLCNKAGIPTEDARGPITSHRARSTIASQLYNSKEPLTLFELQAWLGHRTPHTTQYYAKVNPTRLAKKYADAGYFERNIRSVQVLIDRDAVTSGAAAHGTPWQYFDLGHGWCMNEYFVACPHRMACAKCNYYLPKASMQGQLLEGKSNLIQMRQEIPLTEEEVAAVDEGIEAFEKLSIRLADVPTPAGPTPRQLIQLTRSNESDS